MSQEIDNVAEVEESVGQSESAEKLLTQEKVNEIVKREKAYALEKGRREAMEQLAKQSGEAQAPLEAQAEGGAQGVDDIYAQVKQKMLEDAEREREEKAQQDYRAHLDEVSKKYYDKMSKGKDFYEDFDAITADFDPSAFPKLTYLIAGMDNTSDVVYELARNPQKLATIDYMAEKDPKAAKRQLAKLAESIEANKAAMASKPDVNAPLSRLNPSAKAGANNGKLGIRDLKKASFLKV